MRAVRCPIGDLLPCASTSTFGTNDKPANVRVVGVDGPVSVLKEPYSAIAPDGLASVSTQDPIWAATRWGQRASEPLLRKRQDDERLLDVHGMFSVGGVSGSAGVVASRPRPPRLT